MVATDKTAANNMGLIILAVIASVPITVRKPHNVPTISLQVRHNAYRTGTIASHHETPMIPGFVAMPTVAMPVPKIDITRSMMVSNSLDYGLFYYLLVASCYILTCEFSVFNFCIKSPFIGMMYFLCVRILCYSGFTLWYVLPKVPVPSANFLCTVCSLVRFSSSPLAVFLLLPLLSLLSLCCVSIYYCCCYSAARVASALSR